MSVHTSQLQENSADSILESWQFFRDSCGQIVAINKTRLAYHTKDVQRFCAARQILTKTALTATDSIHSIQKYFPTKENLSKGSFHSHSVAKGRKIVFIVVSILLIIATLIFLFVKRDATIQRLIKLIFKL